MVSEVTQCLGHSVSGTPPFVIPAPGGGVSITGARGRTHSLSTSHRRELLLLPLSCSEQLTQEK